jgi:hypothetical protein
MPSGTIYQRAALAAAISACFPGLAMAAGVARVDFAVGEVTAVAPDGRSRALARGSEIDVGETVATRQGRAQLRFADGAYMSLQPQTEFKVEEFKYSGTGKPHESDNIVMNLLKGGLRTITGFIGRANRKNYRLRTDVATIGIRGTEYSVRYTNSIEVFCADGSIVVQNEGGTLQLSGGQGGYVASNQTPPQQTENRPVLPPESPAGQEIEEQQEQPADPGNPVQESTAGVPAVIAGPATSGLTGTFLGGIARVNPVAGLASGPSSAITMANGALSNADLGGGTVLDIGSAQADNVTNSDGIIAWGRWATGSATLGGSSIDLNSSGPLHWVVGLAAPNQPTTGTATYTMLGATTPSFDGFVTSASVVSSTLAVDFGTLSGSFHAQWVVNGANASTGSSGVPFSISGATLSGSGGIPGGPGAFSGGASIGLAGFLAGDGAVRAGMAYHISATSPGPGNVYGAIAYSK